MDSSFLRFGNPSRMDLRVRGFEGAKAGLGRVVGWSNSWRTSIPL